MSVDSLGRVPLGQPVCRPARAGVVASQEPAWVGAWRTQFQTGEARGPGVRLLRGSAAWRSARDRVDRELCRQLELDRAHAEVRQACSRERSASGAGLAAVTAARSVRRAADSVLPRRPHVCCVSSHARATVRRAQAATVPDMLEPHAAEHVPASPASSSQRGRGSVSRMDVHGKFWHRGRSRAPDGELLLQRALGGDLRQSPPLGGGCCPAAAAALRDRGVGGRCKNCDRGSL